MSEARYIVADVFEAMAKLPDGSVDLIVTSPPFLALRSYLPADHSDKHLEIGSEATPAAFLSTLLALTREWRRLLAPHGSLCVELGDTYSGNERGSETGEWAKADEYGNTGFATIPMSKRNRSNGWPLDKSLCGIPDAYQLSLAYGWNMLDPTDNGHPQWRVRNKIVWHRPNPPVGALGDKVRPSTSYVTVACTSRTRWFDLDAERTKGGPGGNPTRRSALNRGEPGYHTAADTELRVLDNPTGAPPLDMWLEDATASGFDTPTPDVWTIPTAPYHGSHYATWPAALCRKLINLMCPRQVCRVCGEPRRRIVEKSDEYAAFRESRTLANIHPTEQQIKRNESYGVTTSMDQRDDSGARGEKYVTLGWTDCGHGSAVPDNYRRGIVLDPFAGSGTTLMAASELGRDSIGIDLDSRNLDLARQRCGMFLVEDDEAKP
jgi:hypothetical protein